MVKISDDGASDEFGLDDIPCLVYFENGVPQIFTGFLFTKYKTYKKRFIKRVDKGVKGCIILITQTR